MTVQFRQTAGPTQVRLRWPQPGRLPTPGPNPALTRQSAALQRSGLRRKGPGHSSRAHAPHRQQSLKRQALGSRGHCTAGHDRSPSSWGHGSPERETRLTFPKQGGRRTEFDESRVQKSTCTSETGEQPQRDKRPKTRPKKPTRRTVSRTGRRHTCRWREERRTPHSRQ